MADKQDSTAKNNKEKDKKVNGEKNQVDNSANNARVLLSNNRSFYGKNNTFFANNNFNKKSPTGNFYLNALKWFTKPICENFL